jgi:RimJ/RimL family protein N-acetyltransferase
MTPVLAHTPVIETERLTLRAPGRDDWPAFNAFIASPRADFVRSTAYDPELAWRGFGHLVGHWVLRGFGVFVFTLRGETSALGMAGPWFPEGWPEREIGWAVWDGAAEGKGYAFEAAAAARRFAFTTLGWNTAVSYIAPANARSIALARRLGAMPDDAAAHPGTDPCLVFRHAGPEVRA